MTAQETALVKQMARFEGAQTIVAKAFAAYGLTIDAQRLASERAGIFEQMRQIAKSKRKLADGALDNHRETSARYYHEQANTILELIIELGGILPAP